MVLEVDGLLALEHLDGLDDKIDSLALVPSGLKLLGGGVLDVGGPGDVLDGVLGEEVVAPFSELEKSISLGGFQSSALVLSNLVAAGVLIFGAHFTVVDQPVGVLVLVSDDLAVVSEDELGVREGGGDLR